MPNRPIATEDPGSVTDGTTLGGTNQSWSTLGLYRALDGQITECRLLPLDPLAFDTVWSTTS